MKKASLEVSKASQDSSKFSQSGVNLGFSQGPRDQSGYISDGSKIALSNKKSIIYSLLVKCNISLRDKSDLKI